METVEGERERMIAGQLAARGIRDERVLAAMRRVPREAFVAEAMAEFAYADSALPIEDGQTISQPYIVAAMIEAAGIGPRDRVLEIGTGSGYAAAVMAELAGAVFTIERHRALAEDAAKRLKRQGYDDVHVRCGDGTEGWPEEAPFDAIVVAAGGQEVPATLKNQLAIGGRLVIPVGRRSDQRLVLVTRTGGTGFRTRDLGPVAFVPLVGRHGWQAPEAAEDPPAPTETRAAPADAAAGDEADAGRLVAESARPLPDPADPAFAEAFDPIVADARVVLLGESTHGTSEFYRARAAITRRLVERHGFTIVALEADWPDAARIDRHVRRHDVPSPAHAPFARFPAWMWRNTDVAAFVEWLVAHNDAAPDPARKAGVYGLDIYSLHASIAAVLDYLDRHDPEAAAVARARYGCLSPWQHDPTAYGAAAIRSGFAPCAEPVVEVLTDLLRHRVEAGARHGEAAFDAEQNARLVATAETYYRAMYFSGPDSWNLRDRHMFDTLERVMEARGPDAKAVVWAHNTHVGNAAATEMGRFGEFNVGELAKARFGDDARAIGFGTDRGTVAAASDWDGPMEVKTVRPALAGSYERLCARAAPERFLLDLRGAGPLRAALSRSRLERAIGVVYRPETERQSHWFEAELPAQFDAFAWFAETAAVTALARSDPDRPADTFPFGL